MGNKCSLIIYLIKALAYIDTEGHHYISQENQIYKYDCMYRSTFNIRRLCDLHLLMTY